MRKLRKLTKRLLEKSEQAMLIGIEIFNKPTVQYRLESFAIFYTNAWELLLKAKIIEETKNPKAILKPKKRGVPQESISFDEAIQKVFTHETDPVRKNIEEVHNLRNAATHLVVDELEDIYSGLFQRGVLHFFEFMKEWFEINISVTPRMLSLVFDFQPSTVSTIKIRHNHSIDVQQFFQSTQNRIFENIKTYGDNYSIAIGSKLAITKNTKKGDLELGISKNTEKNIAIAIVPKDIKETHPYRVKTNSGKYPSLVDKLNSLISSEKLSFLPKKKLTEYDITAIRVAMNYEPKSHGNYIYYQEPDGKGNGYYRFSEQFVNDMVQKITDEKDFLKNCRSKYKSKKSKNNS